MDKRPKRDQSNKDTGHVGGEQMLIYGAFSAKVSLIRGEQVQISRHSVTKGI